MRSWVGRKGRGRPFELPYLFVETPFLFLSPIQRNRHFPISLFFCLLLNVMASWCAEHLRSVGDWKGEGFNFSTPSDESAKMYDALVRQLTSLRECGELGGFEGTMAKMLEADPKASESFSISPFISLLVFLGKERGDF